MIKQKPKPKLISKIKIIELSITIALTELVKEMVQACSDYIFIVNTVPVDQLSNKHSKSSVKKTSSS